MNKLLSLSFLILLIPLTFSCKKKSPGPEPTPTPAPISKDYLPTTPGSSWQYTWVKQSPSIQDYATDYYYIMDNKITLNGNTYNQVKGLYNNTSESYYYLRKSGDTYYQADSIYDSLYEHTALKDNVKAGDVWVDSVYDAWNRPYGYFKTEIKDVGLTLTIRGKTYTDVVHYVYIADPKGFGPPQYNIQDFYVAKGVGIIKKIVKATGNYMELTDYTIK